ncbi:MAG: hypothetical protein QXP70_02185 [Methanomassiliicoccales archaeon]
MAVTRIEFKEGMDGVREALQNSIEKCGMKIYCVVDHYTDMRENGVTPAPVVTFLFGSHVLSSMLLGRNRELALELPLSLAIVDRGDRRVVVFRDAHNIFTDFQVVNPEDLTNFINTSVDRIFGEMRAVIS